MDSWLDGGRHDEWKDMRCGLEAPKKEEERKTATIFVYISSTKAYSITYPLSHKEDIKSNDTN